MSIGNAGLTGANLRQFLPEQSAEARLRAKRHRQPDLFFRIEVVYSLPRISGDNR